MMLIADSGSTKTDWFFVGKEGFQTHKQTPGINPFYQDWEAIYESIRELPQGMETPSEVFFYGAGCANQEKSIIVSKALKQLYPQASIQINSDLLAAARALCGKQRGIACILGTGSNSCLYNGQKIEKNVSPLGFMLGDEGSGAVMGRKFISDLLKNQLPSSISEAFYKTYNIEPQEIMDRVYKKEFPNRFLAQFTHFLAAHSEQPSISNIIHSSFEEFFNRNIAQYAQHKELEINFTGSVAYHFKEDLNITATRLGYTLGKIEKSPVNGLIQYHLGK